MLLYGLVDGNGLFLFFASAFLGLLQRPDIVHANDLRGDLAAAARG